MHRFFMTYMPSAACFRHFPVVLLTLHLTMFCIAAHAAGSPPTISTIANHFINLGTSSPVLAFTVSDAVTPDASLLVTCVASNTALVPATAIVLTGPDASGVCSVTLTPVAIYSGSSTMILTVKNGSGLTAKTSFTLTVNGKPTISKLANQSIVVGAATSALAFTVGDDLTQVASLTLKGASSNTTLVPTANLIFGGTGATRTATITPAFGKMGSSTITLSVTDGGGVTTTTSFIFTVHAPTPPKISTIANCQINTGTSTPALAFTVSDAVTPATSLLVTCVASNTALVHAAAIVLTGPDATGVCSVTLTPVAVYSGSSTVTLTVKNGSGLIAKTSFTLTVNGRPTITKLANQSILVGTAISALAFTVGDDLTPVASLTLKGASSNTTLVPTANLIFDGTGATRTVTIKPAPGKMGTSTITLSVMDGGGLMATTSLLITVHAPTPPTISTIANRQINMGTSTPALAFTVSDTVTPTASLLVTCVASNTALVHATAIILTGPDASGVCSVTLTPVAAYSGSSTMTLTVKNGIGLTAKTSFTLTVNGKPTITKIVIQNIAAGTATSALAFTVGDDLTPVASLTLTGASSNITLVPKANIVIVGTTASRTVTITPAMGQSGVTTITLTVTDGGGLTATSNIIVSVSSPPVITSFTPTSGANGQIFSIAGTHFNGATVVTCNGIAATSFTVLNDSAINAIIPTGATSGVISVTTAVGKATSACAFTVTPGPTLTATVQDVITALPVCRASVTLDGWSTQTDANGAFSVSSVAVGARTLSITALNYQPYTTMLTCAPASSYTLLLIPTIGTTTDCNFQSQSAATFTTAQAMASRLHAIQQTQTASSSGTSRILKLADTMTQEDTLLQTLQIARALGQLLAGITTYNAPDYATTTNTGKLLKRGWISAPFDFSKMSSGSVDTYSLRDQIMGAAGLALPQVDTWLATHPIDGCISLAEARQLRDDIDGSGIYILHDIAVAYLITNCNSPFNSELVARGSDIVIGQYPTVAASESDLLGNNLDSYGSTLGSLAVSVADVGTLALQNGDQYIWIFDKTLGKLVELKAKPNTDYVAPCGTFDIVVSNGAFYSPTAWLNVYIPPSSQMTLSYIPQVVLTGIYGTKINRIDGAEMLWVPAGGFTMGSIAGVGYSDEQPAHQVTLSGYWIFENEVTVAQYRAFCAATAHTLPPWPGSEYSWKNYTDWTATALQQMPIVDVSWDDARAYADWAGVKLPTEAQYEYAARGPHDNNYPWGGIAMATDPYNGWDQTKCANNYNSCAVGKSTWPVGSFPSGESWCGAQDMTGNVYGWCADWYGNYSMTPSTDPTGPATGDFRVLRGGSWDFDEYNRGATRSTGSTSDFWYNVGFRCVSILPGP